MKPHLLALLQDNCLDLLRCTFLSKFSGCVRNITVFCQHLLRPKKSAVSADILVKPKYRPRYGSISIWNLDQNNLHASVRRWHASMHCWALPSDHFFAIYFRTWCWNVCIFFTLPVSYLMMNECRTVSVIGISICCLCLLSSTCFVMRYDNSFLTFCALVLFDYRCDMEHSSDAKYILNIIFTIKNMNNLREGNNGDHTPCSLYWYQVALCSYRDEWYI